MKNYTYAAPSVEFLKTISMGDLQKEIFKTIKNTVEFAFMFEITGAIFTVFVVFYQKYILLLLWKI